jgi:copper chaperone
VETIKINNNLKYSEMKTQKFKTNIKCSGCEATVTPYLNDTVGAGKWTVNTQVPEKLLTVEADRDVAAEVIAALRKAGYEGALLPAA